VEDPERRDDERTAPEDGAGVSGEAGTGTSEPWQIEASEGYDAPAEDQRVPPGAEVSPEDAAVLEGATHEAGADQGSEETAEIEIHPRDPEAPDASEGTEEAQASEATSGRVDGDVDLEELRARLEIKDNHIRELYERITASRLAADEADAAREAGLGHLRALEDERERLKERIRTLEEKVRERRRRREGIDRNVGRLERENERLRAEVARRDFLLRRREQEMEAIDVEAEDLVTRKDVALIDALRRVEGLERDLDERETEVAELRANVDDLLADLRAEYDLRAHLAEPANRLRAGIELFNESGQMQNVLGLSRSLGQPEVHVDLESGDEPAVILTFTWQGVSWQTYSSNPGLAVEEPRVYMMSAGEDLSGVEREHPNARVGPGGRVLLGL
jgi:ribonucrease Y